MVSAPSRLAAVSKLSRVRVESSKKSDTTVLPRRAGTFGMARALTSTKLSVRRSTSSMPSAPRSAIDEQVPHLRISPSSTPSGPTSTTSSRRVGRFLPT